ncbi:MAG TPA: cupin domain-containing protein [Gemmataceae bacterium]|nr:cupin domain-containing protein [Gemmataceae bacterium]
MTTRSIRFGSSTPFTELSACSPRTSPASSTSRHAPAEIVGRILDLANWTYFTGYAVLPDIKAAEFEVCTPGVVGSRIRVTITDGSSHVEEIVEWQPEKSLRLRMNEFSAPLSRLATEFVESWTFERAGTATRATRSFELYPKSTVARPALWLISLLLRRAIARHLRHRCVTSDSRRPVAIQRERDETMAAPHQPTINTPPQGRTIAVVGDVYRFLATGQETNGKYALFEALVGPGGGPPPHFHSREEEGFYVLEGEITFTVNGERVVAKAGTFANMPVGTPHGFKNEGDRPARMLISLAPAGLEQMFFEVGVPLAEGAMTALPPTKAEIEKLLAVAPGYGITILRPGH